MNESSMHGRPMSRAVFAAIAFLVAAFLLPRSIEFSAGGLLSTGSLASAEAPAKVVGSSMRVAAATLLESLSEEARARASFAFGDEERINWHFIPRPRKGLPLKDMSEVQRELVNALLRTGLSQAGYKTVHDIRGLEAVLQELEGPKRRFPRDPLEYFVSIFGEPKEAGAWGWRFEGHHLTLNFSVRDDVLVSATPTAMGTNPAIVKSGPKKGLRVLSGVEDFARELMQSLDEKQLAQALGAGEPEELKGMQKIAYEDDLPEGLSLARLGESQRETFTRLIDDLIKHHEASTHVRAKKLIFESDPKKVILAWRGSTKPYEGHSYVIHAPGVIFSYANFQNGAAHIHLGIRYTEDEFGKGK